MSRIPQGVPTVTYCRVVRNNSTNGKDLQTEDNVVTLFNTEEVGVNGLRSATRHEVNGVFERDLSDAEICPKILGIGSDAGTNSVSLRLICLCFDLYLKKKCIYIDVCFLKDEILIL